jgi:hypothetical protein
MKSRTVMKSRRKYSLFKAMNFKLSLLLLFIIGSATAQNLDVISLKKGIDASGSVNFNTVAYKAFGMEQRRDPFSWFLSGSLNLTLFGYAAPFSFSYSNAGKNYSQPFNQFRFAPQYKWIKTYTGNTSMTFSPYTLAGHMFYGGGVEVTPGKWRIAAMYGRLRKAVPFNPLDTLAQPNASYKRIGYGIKVGYETNGDAVSFNLFTAKDDIGSLNYIPINSTITPQQNVAMSIAFQKKLFSKVSMNVEYGVSALNTNINANAEKADSVAPSHNLLEGFLPDNTTSRYFDALSASIGYQGKNYGLQVKYERIAPEYQTLGAYYFNNDMRNITLAPSVRLLKNRLSLNANAGLQQNNLDKTRASTSSRIVGAFNAQFTPNEKWNMSGNYSNFSAYTKVRPPTDPFFQNGLDTLNFYQVSQTMGGSLLYSFGDTKAKQTLSANGSYQQASNKAAGTAPPQLSDFVNGSLSYSYSLSPANLTMAIAITGNTNSAAGVRSSFIGPAVNASKAMLDKRMRVSYASSYNQNFGSTTTSSPVWSNQLNFSFSPAAKSKEENSKSSISMGLNLLRRLKDTAQQPAFTELTGTFNYSYSF